jgi:hypothetical protein
MNQKNDFKLIKINVNKKKIINWGNLRGIFIKINHIFYNHH